MRTPERAEELKAKLGALSSATAQIKGLKRSITKSFYEIGQILVEVQSKKLYDVKGYGSFEAYVERETELGKQLALRLVRVPQIFVKEAALAAGVERATAAVSVFDGDGDSTSSGSAGGLPRPALPPHKQ